MVPALLLPGGASSLPSPLVVRASVGASPAPLLLPLLLRRLDPAPAAISSFVVAVVAPAAGPISPGWASLLTLPPLVGASTGAPAALAFPLAGNPSPVQPRRNIRPGRADERP